uniref:Uncharacterized protein n=1 Tax=Steinernema glaseri TaxID=37863 RepID=A0A1I7ZZ99_9BILA
MRRIGADGRMGEYLIRAKDGGKAGARPRNKVVVQISVVCGRRTVLSKAARVRGGAKRPLALFLLFMDRERELDEEDAPTAKMEESSLVCNKAAKAAQEALRINKTKNNLLTDSSLFTSSREHEKTPFAYTFIFCSSRLALECLLAAATGEDQLVPHPQRRRLLFRRRAADPEGDREDLIEEDGLRRARGGAPDHQRGIVQAEPERTKERSKLIVLFEKRANAVYAPTTEHHYPPD